MFWLLLFFVSFVVVPVTDAIVVAVVFVCSRELTFKLRHNQVSNSLNNKLLFLFLFFWLLMLMLLSLLMILLLSKL